MPKYFHVSIFKVGSFHPVQPTESGPMLHHTLTLNPPDWLRSGRQSVLSDDFLRHKPQQLNTGISRTG
jgi:hypothetical protein